MRQFSLDQLDHTDAFVQRHIGPTPTQQQEMAAALGYDSVDAVIDTVVPPSIRRATALAVGEAQPEPAVLARLKAIAERNTVARSFIGCGYYDTFTPPVIQRNVLENPGWYTAYTPYQPEISQGRLEVLLTYQQMVLDLTGMELANASMLDEASAAAEAMTLLHRVHKKRGSEVFLVDEDCHPQTIAVVQTRARPLGIEVVIGKPEALLGQRAAFGALLQYPGSSGAVRDIAPLIEAAHSQDTLVAVATDLAALLLLRSPGAQGADAVLGNSQRFGVPMGFGGPHAAFLATRDSFRRALPGRVIGVSVDRRNQPALRMALQTREQHIRREKATSNICTAQALLAITAALYAMYHGPVGLRRIGERMHKLAATFATGMQHLGFAPLHDQFFDTLSFNVGARQQEILARAAAAQFNLRVVGSDQLGVSFDETSSRDDVTMLWQIFSGSDIVPDVNALAAGVDSAIPAALARDVDYLQHPLFNDYHSETEMLRYLRRMEHRDIALNRSMIPLGSCTMKLNATAEMQPISWPEFNRIHPFAPEEQIQGYRQLFRELEAMLCDCTGYDAMSLQPNAGSQGEYAGLLAIRAYHLSRGDAQRDVCLIPSSAHGTNPASAAMCGMRVVIVACDALGNIDLEDLRAKAEKHSAQLAAIMVTYPSTHGVFEAHIRDVCALIHEHGGQVYVDGANLNALVGIAAPGEFGADVSHLNLHKTFCIPHGGGGPGMGPIGVRAHLAPFLPGHPLTEIPGVAADNDTISATAYGSASILPISWTYIALMGGAGLTQATKVAILNANYIAHRLRDHYPILYTGKQGLVAHECIIDLRPLREQSGISEEDVAKRLMDYGFHAPTMSFPVPGTLMVEPTESESLAELDRFCDAMIRIRREIQAVMDGRWPLEDNPLVNAPHTAAELLSSEWSHPYSREEAAYPLPGQQHDKYWPPVSRVDNVYGDRNLVCSCPPVSSYAE